MTSATYTFTLPSPLADGATAVSTLTWDVDFLPPENVSATNQYIQLYNAFELDNTTGVVELTKPLSVEILGFAQPFNMSTKAGTSTGISRMIGFTGVSRSVYGPPILSYIPEGQQTIQIRLTSPTGFGLLAPKKTWILMVSFTKKNSFQIE